MRAYFEAFTGPEHLDNVSPAEASQSSINLVERNPRNIKQQQFRNAGTLSVARTPKSTPIVGIGIASPKLSKHALRTLETRDLLLKAAEKVFVRDGYEKGDLRKIAELAGRTKGAIYAQFKRKEELFLALVEINALQLRAVMCQLLEKSTSLEGNLASLRKLFMDTASDETWGLLLLEFRLYTVRPDVPERLADLYRSIVPENREATYTAILGSPGRNKNAVSRSVAGHSAFSMLYSLQVESKFEPELFSAASVRKIAGKIFDTMFETESK